MRSLLPKEKSPDVDAAGDFLKLSGDEVIRRLSKPAPLPLVAPPAGGGGAAVIGAGGAAIGGGAAGIGPLPLGMNAGALNFLNYTTYYAMKERAGLVGSKGLHQVLVTVQRRAPAVKLHLIGHSFGGRLVTAAAGTERQPPVKLSTMTLLQAAFSHYGFSEHYEGVKNGFFRKVITGKVVAGPILISCTRNDIAVGKLYPIASLLAGQVAADLGDKNDKYGGLGRNGAQKTPEASDGTLLPVGGAYQLEGGKLYNLNADSVIKEHSDICHPEVAYGLLKVVLAA